MVQSVDSISRAVSFDGPCPEYESSNDYHPALVHYESGERRLDQHRDDYLRSEVLA